MSRIWILYVEDSEDDLRLAWEILPRAEYPVTWASNGASARSHLAAQRFDLLLLDHGLPDTNGLLFLEEIRRTYPRLPVVVVTGRKDDALALSTLAKGAAGYVCKEDLAQLLRPTIERVLAAASPPDDGAATEHLLRFGRLSQILLATMGEGVLLVDAEGVVTYANEAAGEMLGEAPTNLLGQQAGDLFDPATRAQFLASHAAFVARTPPSAARFEGRLRESVPVFVSARSMLEDLGHSEACLLVLSNISSLARARDDLRTRLIESERFQRFFVDREQRIIELKAKLREYEGRLGITASGLSEETRREIDRRLRSAHEIPS